MLPAGDSGLTLGQIGGLIGFSLLLAAGQILFKTAALSAPVMSSPRAVSGLFVLPSFWAALVLYGCATLLWIYLLQTISLSRAYPFAALGFVIVPVAGLLLFGERVNFTYAIGALLVIAGVLMIARA